MKQPKYISICDHLLYLLLANSTLLFLIIYPSIIQAKIVKGEGMSYWGENTSKKEACDLAETEAKNDALRRIGLERLNSNQIEVCIDSGDKENCELYQSTFNTISGGYIKDFVILEKKRGGIKDRAPTPGDPVQWHKDYKVMKDEEQASNWVGQDHLDQYFGNSQHDGSYGSE